MNSLTNISKQGSFACMYSQKFKFGVVDAILAIFVKGLSTDLKMLKNVQPQITFHGKRKCERWINVWYCKETM